MKRSGVKLTLLAAILLTGGCDVFGSEDMLGEFSWTELADPPVTETTDVALIGTDVLFVGELNTPTACYQISPDLDDNGTSITLHIRVRARDRDGCEDRQAAYRYDGFLRRVTRATELRIIHEVAGVGNTEFIHPLGPET